MFIGFVLSSTWVSAKMFSTEDSLNIKYLHSKQLYVSGKYSEAIQVLEEIIDFKQTVKKDIHPNYFKIYNRLGIIYKYMGKQSLSIEFYSKALTYTKSPNNKGNLLMNIANVYSRKGDYSSALVYINQAINLLFSDFESLADAYYNLGNLYSRTGQYQLALENFIISKKIRDENNMPKDGYTLLQCGLTYDKLGKIQLADEYFINSILTFEESLGHNSSITALGYINYASFLTNQKKYKESHEILIQSYRILENLVGIKHDYTSYCNKYLGDLYYQKTDYPKALHYYQKALISKIREFNDTSVYSNPINIYYVDLEILDLFHQKAKALISYSEFSNKKKNLEAAFDILEKNSVLIERLRKEFLQESSKLKLTENENETNVLLVKVSYLLYNLTGNELYIQKAFRNIENNKYVVLRELHNEESAKNKAMIPPELLSDEQNIRDKVNELHILIELENKLDQPDNKKLIHYKDQLFQMTKKLQELIDKLESDFPKYYKLKYGNSKIEIESLQNVLRNDQVAFEYLLSGKELYTFLIEKDTFYMHKKIVDTTFYYHLEFYSEFLHGMHNLKYASYRKSAYFLYDVLLKDYENEIRNKSLLIIPDNHLSKIAFEALVDKPFLSGLSLTYAKQPYLIKKYPIGYAYSANLYVESLLQTRKEKRNKILAFAPGYEYSIDSLPVLPIPRKYLKKLSRFNGKLFLRDKANETNFKNIAGEYNILHIYAHGSEDTLNPSLSRIYFEKSSDSLNDGYLFQKEINDLNLKAKLVVLASCYSGSGKISEGEGVLSLGRSFLLAGSKALIISLWKASYEPTIEELNNFRKYLTKGFRKDEALRLAKLDYLENSNEITSHPSYWASLVLIGNQNPINNSYQKQKILFIVSCIFFIALLCYYLFKKRNK
jgi:CHAT domain-containing protein/Tfp pilus assembly protein PilF